MKSGLIKIVPIVLIGYFCFVAGRILSVRETAQPETVESITLAAKEALNNKNYGAAVKQYNRALALRPGDAALHGSLGLALAKGGRTQDAIDEFEKCLVLDPERFDITKQLGMALYKFERFKEAKERFETVVQQRPEDAEAYEWLFTINNRVDQQLDNLPVLERLAELRPDDPQYIYAQIMVYHQNDLFEDALKTYEKLSPKERETSKARYVQAAIYFQQKDYDTAIAQLEQLVQDDPDHADAQKLLKDARNQAEMTEKYEKEFARLKGAIEAKPDDPEARFQLGYALTKAGRPEEAQAAFQETMSRLKPEDVDQAKQMGRILNELGLTDLAQQFLELVADEANDVEVYELLLAINTQRNEPLKSIPILQKMAELKPEESKYLSYQLGIYVENNMPEEALQLLKSLPEEKQKDPTNRFILGVVYYQLKDHAKAIEVLEQVVTTDPDNADAKKLLELCRTQASK